MMLPMLLVLLLITSIVSGLCYQKTDNDIFGVLAIAGAIACLIWGLVIAHWTINLLGLVFLLRFRTPILGWVQVDK